MALGVLLCSAEAMALPTDPICDVLDSGSEAYITAGCDDPEDETVFSRIPGALSAVYGIAGVIAVVVIMIGGVRYVLSQGESDRLKQAKDMILYAVIGLVITLLAFAITVFVVENIITDDGAGDDVGLVERDG